jgi:hypothetical protein
LPRRSKFSEGIGKTKTYENNQHKGDNMAKMTPEQRWDQIVKQQDRGAYTRRKLVANRHRNWLVALAAHACAKAQGRARLSDLEEHLVQTLREASHKTNLVAAFAHLQSATPPNMKSEIFPTGFDGLIAAKSVTFADLGRMAPDLAKGVVKAPNTKNLDITAIHSGKVKLRDQIRVPRSVLRTHASSLLRVVSSDAETPKKKAKAAPLAAPIANRYLIKAVAFRCLEETSEWSSHDEPYWFFASVAKGYQAASSSHVFTDVDAGEGFYFEPNEGCFWGMDCQPHTFPDGDIGAIVTLMEHDEGDVSDEANAWYIAVGGITGVLAVSGVAAWVGAVVGALGGFIGVLIEFMNDDHIADQTYTFDRKSINEIIDKHGGWYDAANILTDGDCQYKLRTRVSRVV